MALIGGDVKPVISILVLALCLSLSGCGTGLCTKQPDCEVESGPPGSFVKSFRGGNIIDDQQD
jgi:hypothetical protein